MTQINPTPTTDICWGDMRYIESLQGKENIFEWSGTDSKVNYENNCRTNPKAMEFWKDKKISYRFNKYGFRSSDFQESDNNIVFLGCSHTVGIGLALSDTFSYLVSKELGMNLCNLGCAGGSNDTAYRMSKFWIPQLKPKIVVYKVVQQHRFEFKMYGNNIQFWQGFHPLKENKKVCDKNFGDYYEQWALHDENSEYNRSKNIDAVETICRRNGAKLVVMEEKNRKRQFCRPENRARDLQHPGIEENKVEAMEILQMLGESK